MKTNTSFQSGKKSVRGWLTLLALSVSVNLGAARAATFTWNTDAGDGPWSTLFASLWLEDGADAASPPTWGADVEIIAGAAPLTVTLIANYNPPSVNSLTVGANTMFVVQNGNRFTISGGFTNSGTMRYTSTTNNREIQIGGISYNCGLLLVSNTNAVVDLTGGGLLDNTGGVIRVDNGGRLSLRTQGGLTGGAVQVGVSSTFYFNDIQIDSSGKTMLFNNVAIANEGVWLWHQEGNSSDRSKPLALNNGAVSNSGTFNLRQSGIGNATANIARSLTVTATGANQFTNSGVVNVLNDSADTSTQNQFAQLNVSVSGGGFFRNDGVLNILNNAAGDTNGSATFLYARATVSAGADFTNSGTINISVSGANNDAQHYATLLINDDWTNTGVINVDGANKSFATASLDLGAKNYTQTGAAAELHLNDGGKVIAKNVTINSGIISASGTGVITGNAVINSGATWEIGALGVDMLNVSGDLTLSGATLSLTGAISAGDWLLASYGGDMLGATLNLSGLSTDFEYLLNASVANQLYLNITAIPEPAAWALLSVSGVALLLTLQRQRSTK